MVVGNQVRSVVHPTTFIILSLHHHDISTPKPILQMRSACPSTPATTTRPVSCTIQQRLDSFAFVDDTPEFVPRKRGRRRSMKKLVAPGKETYLLVCLLELVLAHTTQTPHIIRSMLYALPSSHHHRHVTPLPGVIQIGNRFHRRVPVAKLNCGPSARRGKHLAARARCVECYDRAPPPKTDIVRKKFMSDGKCIPQTTYACDVCRKHLCRDCFHHAYDHGKGGRRFESVTFRL